MRSRKEACGVRRTSRSKLIQFVRNNAHITKLILQWYGGKCAIDAHLLPLDETLKNYILDTFNTLRNTVARGGYSGFTEAARMGTMVWQTELAEIAKFNVLICKLHQDDCRNTAEYKDVGQSAGYRALHGRSEHLNRSIKATINLWFNEQAKTSMDEVLKYRHEYR